MPHVIVKLWPGKSEQQKQRLADQITRDVMDVLNYGEESVSVAIEEIPAADWPEKVYKPEIIKNAWEYYNKEQTKEIKYTPLISKDDKPAIQLNKEIMEKFRPEMSKYYYDATKYKTYLEQLGIKYPTVREETKK